MNTSCSGELKSGTEIILSNLHVDLPSLTLNGNCQEDTPAKQEKYDISIAICLHRHSGQVYIMHYGFAGWKPAEVIWTVLRGEGMIFSLHMSPCTMDVLIGRVSSLWQTLLKLFGQHILSAARNWMCTTVQVNKIKLDTGWLISLAQFWNFYNDWWLVWNIWQHVFDWSAVPQILYVPIMYLSSCLWLICVDAMGYCNIEPIMHPRIFKVLYLKCTPDTVLP